MLSRRLFLTQCLWTACTPSLKHFPFDRGNPILPNALRITYYSVGCFLVEWKGEAFLTDPFWSHPSFLQVTLGKTIPISERVAPYIKDIQHAQAILVGHSHYDHALDLPYILPKLPPTAQVLGSQTLKHTFATLLPAHQFIVCNPHVASLNHGGQFLYTHNKRIRILPIQSSHPAQVGWIHLFQDSLHHDRRTPPTRSWHYQEGITLAFLVDFLDADQTIQKRVYVQTSSRGFPSGAFPKEILSEHPVDVALLGMDCANTKYRGQPSIIDYLKARHVVFCHWEDFFRHKEQAPKARVKAHLPKLKQYFESLEQEQEHSYIFPYFDSTFWL